MAELFSVGRPTKKKTSSMKPDWTQCPEELLQVISEHLDNCFDVVHARSVCTLWRSAFPFPSSLIPPSYSLPTYPIEKNAERKWVRLKNVPGYACKGLVTFRGRFYANFDNRDVFVIDPYSLEATHLMPTPLLEVNNHIVQSGNDELFVVEKNVSIFRVSKLDKEAGRSRWIEVSNLGDHVLLLGRSGNVCFLAKELLDRCGVSGNSILITDEPRDVTFFYKYEVNCWILSSENLVMILNKLPVLSLRVGC
ncbi:unnamed protein product [Arabis nemorensis]|uniref:F-box domain-containing protein n=1 Tax=Arabis nemorensis TaxID=586526 RepID=A0A565C5R1_9BRAS|nr:unnamed protein product [Arabis nemorensis]